MVGWVRSEEISAVCQSQGDRLETLEKLLHQSSSGKDLDVLETVTGFEEIFCVVDLVLNQGRVMNPGSMFDKASSCLIERSIMDSEPSLWLFIDLVHDLEDRSFFQEIVADFALKITKNLEEFKTIHLRASHEFFQGIGQG